MRYGFLCGRWPAVRVDLGFVHDHRARSLPGDANYSRTTNHLSTLSHFTSRGVSL